MDGEPPPQETRYVLTQPEVKKSIQNKLNFIFRQNTSIFTPEQLSRLTMASINNESTPQTRCWFQDTFMPRELKEAVNNNEESESITNKAGAWEYREYPENMILNVGENGDMSKINQAIENVTKDNNEGLLELYNQGSFTDTFEFKDRLKPKNINLWIKYISSERILNGERKGKSYKEWDVEMDKNGKYHEIENKKNHFMVKIVGDDNNDNHHKDIIDHNLVAKIVLKKDRWGNLISVRILNSHLRSDEPHGRRLLKEINKGLGISDKNLKEPPDDFEILRKFDYGKKGDTGVDMKINWKSDPEETALIKMASASEKVPFSVIKMLCGRLLPNNERAGYLCVDAKENGSALQVALIPAIEQLNFLRELKPRLDLFQPIADQLIKLFPEDKLSELKKILPEFEEYIHQEISDAQKGIGSPALLDSRISNLSQNIFKAVLAPDASHQISGGVLQDSSVDLWRDGLSKVEFVTALSAYQNSVLGTNGDKESLRNRVYDTNNKSYLNLKSEHFDRMTESRFYTAMAAFTIAYANSPEGQRAGLIEQANKTFEKILNIKIPKDLRTASNSTPLTIL